MMKRCITSIRSSVFSVFSVLSVAIPFCFLALTITGCSKPEDARAGAGPTTAPATVTTAPVKVDAAQRTVDVPGTLYGDEEATISAKVSGRSEERRVGKECRSRWSPDP